MIKPTDMLLARIQRDLFDFTERDPDDFSGLVEFWYRANSEALSAALSAALMAHHGLNLILNVRSFSNFETLAKRLFLLADMLILRDTRDWAQTRPAIATCRSRPANTGRDFCRIAHLKEQGELTDKKGYFLWRLRNDISGGK